MSSKPMRKSFASITSSTMPAKPTLSDLESLRECMARPLSNYGNRYENWSSAPLFSKFQAYITWRLRLSSEEIQRMAMAEFIEGHVDELDLDDDLEINEPRAHVS